MARLKMSAAPKFPWYHNDNINDKTLSSFFVVIGEISLRDLHPLSKDIMVITRSSLKTGDDVLEGRKKEATGKQRKKTAKLTEKQKLDIIEYHAKGISSRKIGKVVNCSKSTVIKLVNKVQTHGTIARLKGSPRPRVTTNATDRLIVRQAKSNPRVSCREIRENLEIVNIHVSNRTMRRRLHAAGLRARVARAVPMLSSRNVKKRLQYGKKVCQDATCILS